MKKILLIVLACLIVTTVYCFAQEPAAQMTTETKTLVGKVESVTLGEPAVGEAVGTIGVIDETGEVVYVIVGESTTIFNPSMFAISLDDIEKGNKVQVKYLKTKNDKNEAISINIVK